MAALHISAGRQMETTMIVSHNKYKQLPCPLCLEGFAEGAVGYIGTILSGAKPSTWRRLVTSATRIYE